MFRHAQLSQLNPIQAPDANTSQKAQLPTYFQAPHTVVHTLYVK